MDVGRSVVVLKSERIELTFVEDPAVGVSLEQLRHTEHGGTMVFRVGGAETAGLGLWELGCTLADGREVTVRPGDGFADFTWTNEGQSEGAQCMTLLWSGVQIPGAAEGDTVDVEVRVVLAAQDRVSRWWSQVRRVRGRSASIDRVDLPVLRLQGPVEPQAGVSHVDAQKGARLILPFNFFEATPFFSQNTPLWLWIASGATADMTHPGFQTLQFTAVAAMDPADPVSFRRMLYFGTEDTEGHIKRFLYRGLVQDGKGYVELRARHIPAYTDDAVAGDRTGRSNSYRSPYPTVLGALHAGSDAFWFDACAQYRDFVERSGFAGPKRKHNRRLSALRENALLVGNIQYLPLKVGAELHYGFLQTTADLAQALGVKPRVERPVFMHWQNTLQGGGQTHNPEYPVQNSLEPDMRPVVGLAFRQGIRTSGYSEGLFVPRRSRWRRFLTRADEVHRRDGTLEMPDQTRFDFGSENAQRFPAERMQKDMVELCGFSGLYVDGASGVFNFLAYDPPGDVKPAHAPHGGSYVTRGKVRLFDNLRDMLQRTAPGQTADGDPQAYLMSEAIQEYLVGKLDFAQEGYIFIPNHMILAEERAWASSLVPLGIERVPVEARNMSPPLWSAVYNEWCCSGRLTIPLSANGLATNFRRYPVDGQPGLSAAEWTDLLVFLHACPFLAGLNWMLANVPNADPLFRWVDGRVEVDPEIDPERTGATILTAIGHMARAFEPIHAGEFVTFGRMERPLVIDYDHPEVRLLRNPVHACRKSDPRDFGATYPSYMLPPFSPYQAGQAWASADFPVVQVMHSVWRSDTGRLGLLLYNWSGEPGAWRGRLDPGLYGWPRGTRLRVLRRNGDGGEMPIGTFARPMTLRVGEFGARSSGVLDLGPLPPRSLLVVVVEAAPR